MTSGKDGERFLKDVRAATSRGFIALAPQQRRGTRIIGGAEPAIVTIEKTGRRR
jgi:hypothetical protein